MTFCCNSIYVPAGVKLRHTYLNTSMHHFLSMSEVRSGFTRWAHCHSVVIIQWFHVVKTTKFIIVTVPPIYYHSHFVNYDITMLIRSIPVYKVLVLVIFTITLRLVHYQCIISCYLHMSSILAPIICHHVHWIQVEVMYFTQL